MTDAETFAAICADFPFDIETLDALHKRLDRVLGKSQNAPPLGAADGTIGDDDWKRLRALTWAMRDLVLAMTAIEAGAEPDDDIPF